MVGLSCLFDGLASASAAASTFLIRIRMLTDVVYSSFIDLFDFGATAKTNMWANAIYSTILFVQITTK